MENNNSLKFFNEEFIDNTLIRFFIKYYNEYSNTTKFINFDNDLEYKDLLHLNYNEIIIDFQQIYKKYSKWAIENGYKALSEKNFRDKIEKEQTQFINLEHSLDWTKIQGKHKVKTSFNTILLRYKYLVNTNEIDDKLKLFESDLKV